MLIQHQDTLLAEPDERQRSGYRLPALDQFDSVRDHVQTKLHREVVLLEKRIDALRKAPTPHSAIIIDTYERMIDRKLGFMRRWGMDESI
ncbi:hypothetical protein [Mangrovitalea sediminis]|uniref:hypothetical protein n=1 Tax=Mangrovitalea sediminis TaxID=1982043 RepID=UPI001D0CFC62|nr:hypothetical protein [Mangrovitalea sediminis]